MGVWNLSHSFIPLNIRNEHRVISFIKYLLSIVMKKLKLILSVACLFVLSAGVMAQSHTTADYFAGKWNMLVKGLPNGDTRMFVVLDKKDSTLAGNIQDSVGTEISKFSKVEIRDSGITVYFTAQGYDVYMTMNKKDEDHVTGSMMDMFDAEGIKYKSDK